MIVNYNEELLNKMGIVLRDTNEKYSDFIKSNDNIDNIDYLCSLLNDRCKGHLDVVTWEVDKKSFEDEEMEWFFATTEVDSTGKGVVHFVLKEQNLDNYWEGPQFEYEILSCFCHEAIHLEQYKRVGYDRLAKIESGYQKGVKAWEQTGEENDLWKAYYGDIHEIMAYGHNLALEIINSSDTAESIRNPEEWLEELTTYYQFRTIYKKDTKIIKRLLKYTYEYVEDHRRKGNC